MLLGAEVAFLVRRKESSFELDDDDDGFDEDLLEEVFLAEVDFDLLSLAGASVCATYSDGANRVSWKSTRNNQTISDIAPQKTATVKIFELPDFPLAI